MKPTKSERYIKASNEGAFTYTEEFEILEHLVNKFNLISAAEYAKRENISAAGVNARLKASNDMHLVLIGKTMIVS